MHNTFKAGVQYNDFTGTVAADQSDELSLAKYLQKLNLADENERVVSVRLSFGGNHGADIEPGVVVYLVKADQFVEKPARVRAIEIDMPTAKLFSFYKRFDLVMTNKSVDLTLAEIDGPQYD